MQTSHSHKFSHLLLLLIGLISSGCAVTDVVHKSGKYRNVLKPGTEKKVVLATLGAPIRRHEYFDRYMIKGKVSDHRAADRARVGWSQFGFFELIILPFQIIYAPIKCFSTYEVDIFYSINERVDHVDIGPWRSRSNNP